MRHLSKPHFFLSLIVFIGTLQLIAQAPPPVMPTGVPSSNPLPSPDREMLQRLNQTDGSWSFTARVLEGEEEVATTGVLLFVSHSGPGHPPVWQMKWQWPADNPTHQMTDTIMIPPNPTMVDLRLIRSIRTLHQVANTPPQHSMSLNFSGTWNAETQTLVWNEIPKAVSVNKTGNLGSFELVFPETGGLNLQNSERIKTGQLISAETTEVLEPSGK